MEKFIICPKDAFDDGKRYLTEGVKYKVIHLTYEQDLASILDDNGETRSVFLPCSAHTDNLPWQLVEEE